MANYPQLDNASGVWNLREVYDAVMGGYWPNFASKGIAGGGQTPSTTSTIQSVTIASDGNASFFGDLVISREDTKDGEIIKQNILKGGILTSDICLLDDISRAPGESLNVLLRILNERKYGEEDIPLLTAIATSNPTADEYYNEPLDPANLDRFVIQVNSNGISYGKQWEDVKKVISLYATKNGANNFVAKVGKKALDDSYKNLQSVVIPVEVQEGLVSFITWLVEDQRLNESNSVISDRTFLVKSLKLIKASAVIDNRNEANLSDLKVLKFLLPFRVPEEILEAAEQKLESLENQKKKTKK